MDAADDTSETMSEASLYSKRSIHSVRPPGTPGTPGARNNFLRGKRPGSMRGGSIRGGDEAVSDVSRDVGGLDMEGWDEKFVYKVNDKLPHIILYFAGVGSRAFAHTAVPYFMYVLCIERYRMIPCVLIYSALEKASEVKLSRW